MKYQRFSVVKKHRPIEGTRVLLDGWIHVVNELNVKAIANDKSFISINYNIFNRYVYNPAYTNKH